MKKILLLLTSASILNAHAQLGVELETNRYPAANQTRTNGLAFLQYDLSSHIAISTLLYYETRNRDSINLAEATIGATYIGKRLEIGGLMGLQTTHKFGTPDRVEPAEHGSVYALWERYHSKNKRFGCLFYYEYGTIEGSSLRGDVHYVLIQSKKLSPATPKAPNVPQVPNLAVAVGMRAETPNIGPGVWLYWRYTYVFASPLMVSWLREETNHPAIGIGAKVKFEKQHERNRE